MGLATDLDRIQADKAVDLGSDKVKERGRRRKRLAVYQVDVKLEAGRLNHRGVYLRQKASRLPVRSNGRREALAEANSCLLLAAFLGQALQGVDTPKIPVGGPRSVQRGIRMLHTLQAA